MFFEIPHKPQYRSSIEFYTTIATKVKGDEQRHCRWFNPKRTFELHFGNTKENAQALEEFFVAQKGDYELFYWNFDVTGFDYKCFFEGDNLSQKMLEKGYSDTSLSFVCVDDGNILRDRFLQDASAWGISGGVNFADETAHITGEAVLSQAGILECGQDYVLEVFCDNLQGGVPVLSESSSAQGLDVRSFQSGINKIEFTAVADDFVVEIPQLCSCDLSDFSLARKYVHKERFGLCAKAERTKECAFRTLQDEGFSFQNNRRAMWDEPLRRWVLTFGLNPSETLELMEFFIAQKGRYKSFLWNDGTQDFNVRFDTDKLDFEHFELGYSQVQVPIVELRG